MNKLILCALIVVAIADSTAKETPKGSEPLYKVTEQTDNYKVYGASWPHNINNQTPIGQAIETNSVGETAIFSGKITQVCQKKGCWMMLTQGDSYARVDFNNHSFFIPKDSYGDAEVYGTLKEKTYSKKQKEHYESEGAPELSQKMYEVVADSVKIIESVSE